MKKRSLGTVMIMVAASWGCGDATPPGAGGDGKGNGSGGGGSVGACQVFPPDNAWNTDVSGLALHPRSDAFIDSIGRDRRMHPDFGTEWQGVAIGVPYVVVGKDEPKLEVTFVDYGDESDPGPYPIPGDAPVEGGQGSDGDRHAIAVDRDGCKLYELYRAFPRDGGTRWEASSGAIWDLTSNASRPKGWTSADAAGLPVFPGLVRYDEVVVEGVLAHAVRFTVSRSQAGYIAPAVHHASSSSDANLPPMGLRLRMKAGYDCSGYSQEAQVICRGLKTYGMIVADNGSNWYLSGAPDPRWDDEALGDLKTVPGDAFEVVYTGDVETD